MRTRFIVICLGAVWLLSLADLGLTVTHLSPDDELNPLGARLLSPAWHIVAFKIALTLLGTVPLWLARHRNIAALGAAFGLLAYLAVIVWWLIALKG